MNTTAWVNMAGIHSVLTCVSLSISHELQGNVSATTKRRLVFSIRLAWNSLQQRQWWIFSRLHTVCSASVRALRTMLTPCRKTHREQFPQSCRTLYELVVFVKKNWLWMVTQLLSFVSKPSTRTSSRMCRNIFLSTQNVYDNRNQRWMKLGKASKLIFEIFVSSHWWHSWMYEYVHKNSVLRCTNPPW